MRWPARWPTRSLLVFGLAAVVILVTLLITDHRANAAGSVRGSAYAVLERPAQSQETVPARVSRFFAHRGVDGPIRLITLRGGAGRAWIARGSGKVCVGFRLTQRWPAPAGFELGCSTHALTILSAENATGSGRTAVGFAPDNVALIDFGGGTAAAGCSVAMQNNVFVAPLPAGATTATAYGRGLKTVGSQNL